MSPGDRPTAPERPRLDLDAAGIRSGAAGVFSRNTLAFPHLEALLAVAAVVPFPRRRDAGRLAFVVGWGDKPSAARPRAFAAATGVPFVAAEDGFLRSVGNHRVKPPPLSLVLDDEGIYYRAATRSRLERLIAEAPRLALPLRAAAAAALDRVRREKLTKYNTFSAGDAATGGGATGDRPIRLLLVDQVFGDQSIAGGLADAATFARMAEAALATAPAADIAVKVHPDVIAGRARGYLLDIARTRGLALLADAGNPFDLLERVEAVFTVSSQLGFEALVAGKPVACFGVPFYAGWGLTDDRPGNPAAAAALARRATAAAGPRDLLDLFAAAYVAYPRYADPVSGAALDVGAAIDRLVEWRIVLADRRRGVVVIAPPFGPRLAEAVFGGGGAPVTVAADAAAAAKGPVGPGAEILAWADAATPRPAGRTVGPALLRDDRLAGAYGFDGAVRIDAGADVAALLAAAAPSAAERTEARAVLDALAAAPFARIAVGRDATSDAVAPGDRHVVALILPMRPTAGDGAVVAAARQRHPAAKLLVVREAPRPRGPSPAGRLTAVVAAHRAPPAAAARSPLAAAATHLAAVHVVDSELAFDALALGIPVVVHGRPEFCGWGPTEDLAPVSRPRRHDVESLVALVVVRAGRHTDPASGLPARPSELLALGRRLAEGRQPVGPDPELLADVDRAERRLKALARRLRPSSGSDRGTG